MIRDRPLPILAVLAVAAAVPAAALAAVDGVMVMFPPSVHFVGVGVSALAATIAALALTLVGARRDDTRTVLVGTAFSSMAALLAVHGFATPGILVGQNGLVAFTGGATVPVGGAVLMLSTLPALRRRSSVRGLLVLQVLLLTVIAATSAAGMLFPGLVPAVPAPNGRAALTLLAAGLAMFGLLAVRATKTFALTRRLGDLAVVVGIVWLAASLAAELTLSFWDLGWWLGHGLELLGLGLVGGSVALDLHRGAQSRPLAGDFAAVELVAAEHAFLGSHVRALTVRLAEKDEYTEGHTRRVALRAVQVGERLGLPPHRLRELAIGGLVHDIGKLSVPDEILKKPASLSDEEYEVVRRHPEWGNALLGELGGFSSIVQELVLHHHERLDGTGYPHGLTAAELELETRILAVCDVYDALISARVYRDAWSQERAMALLSEESDSSFDARWVEALESVLAEEREPLAVAV